MKTLFALAAAGFVAVSSSAFAQSSLPQGIYDINGTVTSATGGSYCPLAINRPVTGHIYYPGVGHDTTQMVLESVQLGKSVTVAFMFAFPAVPAGGLNGWTTSPNYAQYDNGKTTDGGSADYLTFSLKQNQQTYLPIAQGTLTFGVETAGPCQETVQALFTRVANFKEY